MSVYIVKKRLAYENILAFHWMRMGKLKNSLLKTMFRVACTSVGCFPFQLHSEFYPVADVIYTRLCPAGELQLDYSTIYEKLRDKFATSGAPLMQGAPFHEQEQVLELHKQWEQKYDECCLLSSERLKKVYKCEQDWNPREKGFPGYKFRMFLSKNGSICNSTPFFATQHPFGINVFARNVQVVWKATGELNMDKKTRENLTTCMYVISSEHFLRKILGDAVVDKFADGFDSVMEDVKTNRERLRRGIEIHHDIFLKSESKGSLAPTVIVKSYFTDFSLTDKEQALVHHYLTLQFTINIESNVLKKIELFEYYNRPLWFRPKSGICLYERKFYF